MTRVNYANFLIPEFQLKMAISRKIMKIIYRVNSVNFQIFHIFQWGLENLKSWKFRLWVKSYDSYFMTNAKIELSDCKRLIYRSFSNMTLTWHFTTWPTWLFCQFVPFLPIRPWELNWRYFNLYRHIEQIWL